jgi:hypothetical protein
MLSHWAGVAHAGPVERFSDITLHPGDPNHIAIGYENGLGGLFVSNDGGRTFRIRNSQSIPLLDNSYFPRTGFPLLYTDDTLLIGGAAGLLEGDIASCGLKQNAHLLGAWLTAVARHPHDTAIVFTVSTDANAKQSRLFRRTKAGVLESLGTSDAGNLLVTNLTVVNRDHSAESLRFVEGAVRTQDAGASSLLVRYSDDLGERWVERTLPFAGPNALIAQLAVDPIDPDLFLVVLQNKRTSESTGHIFISTDAGKTFVAYLNQAVEPRYTALASDGRFWLGDRAGGLWYAPRIGHEAKQIQNFGVYCLAYDQRQDAVLVCRDNTETGLDELGRVHATQHTYCRISQISDVLGFPDCVGEALLEDPKTTDQICASYCNASHFWFAPICAAYDDPTAACGRGAATSAYRRVLASDAATVECSRAEKNADSYDTDAGSETASAAAVDGAEKSGDDKAMNSGCSVFRVSASSPQASSVLLTWVVWLALGICVRPASSEPVSPRAHYHSYLSSSWRKATASSCGVGVTPSPFGEGNTATRMPASASLGTSRSSSSSPSVISRGT